MAVNVTLPALLLTAMLWCAVLLGARRLLHGAPAAGAGVRAAIDRCLLPTGPTAANPPNAAAAVDSWDRQTGIRTERPTDGRTPYRYTDPAAYYANSVTKLTSSELQFEITRHFSQSLFQNIQLNCAVGLYRRICETVMAFDYNYRIEISQILNVAKYDRIAQLMSAR